MEYPYFKGLEADRYSFYRVPKALVKADLFQKMSGDAKLLYAVLLDRMSLSIKNGWQDKHGNAYIICTIEEVMDSIHCARQKAVKLLDELEHEFRLIERRRQGLGKPNLLYVKDLYAGLSQSNYWKYENHTSGGLKNELPGVLKSNGSNTEKINKTDNSETDLIYPAELQEEEQYRRYFKEALELEILEQSYPADKAVLYEILELLVETVTSRKKFLRIKGGKITAQILKVALIKLLAEMDKKKQQAKGEKSQCKKTGRQSIKSLQKSGAQITNIVVTDNNIKSFDRVARKYGIDYSLKKVEQEGKTEYLVFFKAKDVDVMTAAFKEYTSETLKKQKRESVRQKLEKVKEELSNHRQLKKEKKREQEPIR